MSVIVMADRWKDVGGVKCTVKLTVRSLNTLLGVVLVVTTCNAGGAHYPVYLAQRVCDEYGVRLEYAHCIEDMRPNMRAGQGMEARETGIILRYLWNNYDRIANGDIERVMFHHAHETAWHQVGRMSDQLRKLFGNDDGRRYLLGNDFGGIYAHYGDKRQRPLTNMSVSDGEGPRPGCSVIHNGKNDQPMDVMQILTEWTAGTLFQWLNTSLNRYHCLRHAMSAQFFVSSRLILKRPKSAYADLISRIPNVSRKYGDFFVGWVSEFTWGILFSNQTFLEYDVPVPAFFGPVRVLSQYYTPMDKVFYPPCATCLY